MRAACFVLLSRGYTPRCALDINDSGAVRFVEIVKMITECEFSIHDISRVEIDRTSALPRFNMPLELGADLGLRIAGPKLQSRRRTLILDTELHRYDKTLSDISGMDISAHHNEAGQVIKVVRDWLKTGRNKASRPFPGATALQNDYAAFQKISTDIIVELRLDLHDQLDHADYLAVVKIALPRIEAERLAAR